MPQNHNTGTVAKVSKQKNHSQLICMLSKHAMFHVGLEMAWTNENTPAGFFFHAVDPIVLSIEEVGLLLSSTHVCLYICMVHTGQTGGTGVHTYRFCQQIKHYCCLCCHAPTIVATELVEEAGWWVSSSLLRPLKVIECSLFVSPTHCLLSTCKLNYIAMTQEIFS